MMKNRCVIYARFSSEDEIKDSKSRSITNQIEILKEYASNSKLIVTGVYYDYMYSGSNFNRPQVKKLIEDAHNDKFDILLLKDLSRFGRNYIDVGTYIDDFISRGIRIIAVNDHYDSLLDVDFIVFATKNLLNQFYVKEASRKIRKINEKRAHVEPLANRHYGYICKDKKFYIYKPEANIVKRIFAEAKSFKPISKIALDLTNDKILPPSISFYKKMKYEEKLEKLLIDSNLKWNTESVRKILNDEFYTGSAINFKPENNPKSSIDINIRILNNHKPIISKEEFDSLDRTYFINSNNDIRKENLRHMIYCKKCLSKTNLCKGKSSITAMNRDDKKVYYDHQCEREYPVDIMNSRIYDMLRNRYREIKYDTENYINRVISEKYVDATDIRMIAANKKKYEEQAKKLFESFIDGKIGQDTYKKKSLELGQLINSCETKLKSTNLENYKADEVRNKIMKFLNHYYESEDIISVIKEFVSTVLYDPDTGEINLVLKFEDELDIPSKRINSLVKVKEPTLKDFDFEDIVFNIIKNNPHIKGPEILNKSHEIFDKFTLFNLQAVLRSLRMQNKIKFDGKASLTDGYVVLDYKDDLDYGGLTLNQREKSIYRMLWYDPKLKYEDIASATNLSLDWVRRIIKKIRRLDGFKDKRFDKNYIPEGYIHSIYVDDARTSSGFVQSIYKYIDENPNVTGDEIVNKYNITLEKAQKYIERRKQNGIQ